MKRKIDPFDYNPTEEWLAGSDGRRAWNVECLLEDFQ